MGNASRLVVRAVIFNSVKQIQQRYHTYTKKMALSHSGIKIAPTSNDSTQLYINSENADIPQSGKQSNIEGATLFDTDTAPGTKSQDTGIVHENAAKDEVTCKLKNREEIIAAANALIDDLNNKRKQDRLLMEDFKKILELQVQRTCAAIEQRLFHVYEEQGKKIEEKLQALFTTLDRIATTEKELAEFREALRLLYTDINSTQA